MRSFRHFTWIDRLIIEKLYNNGHSLAFIALNVGFAESSVSREVKRGLYPHLGAETTKRPFHYSAQIAQDSADSLATSKGPALKLGHNYDFCNHVRSEISAGRSVAHIVSDLREQGKFTVSAPTLYRYIDSGYIPGVSNAVLPEKSRRKRKYHVVKASRAPKGRSIESRPAVVSSRSTFGHWEMDSVIGKSEGKNESILVLTERLTRYELIFKVPSKSSASTVRALDCALSKFPVGTFKTITVDNGSEFQDCFGMEHDRDGNRRLDVYYCHPFSSCERGSNERNNRIIRRFLPKGRSMAKVTQGRCDEVAHFMNTMRRGVLGYETADNLFFRQIAQLAG